MDRKREKTTREAEKKPQERIAGQKTRQWRKTKKPSEMEGLVIKTIIKEQPGKPKHFSLVTNRTLRTPIEA